MFIVKLYLSCLLGLNSWSLKVKYITTKTTAKSEIEKQIDVGDFFKENTLIKHEKRIPLKYFILRMQGVTRPYQQKEILPNTF